jgi:predicted HTH transcriptional regulator
MDSDDRIVAALQRPVETRDTEFKESRPFEALRWKLVKACIAMANLRGGGRIIIGVAEQDGWPKLDGMVREHEAGYTQDDLYALVNRYARPFVRLEVRFVEFDRKRFIGIEIREFERSFIFCGNAMPQEAGNSRLLVGDIPARSLDAIATTKVHDADLVAELIEIAAEKRAADIISTAQRIGLKMPEQDRDLFAAERADFEDFG